MKKSFVALLFITSGSLIGCSEPIKILDLNDNEIKVKHYLHQMSKWNMRAIGSYINASNSYYFENYPENQKFVESVKLDNKILSIRNNKISQCSPEENFGTCWENVNNEIVDEFAEMPQFLTCEDWLDLDEDDKDIASVVTLAENAKKLARSSSFTGYKAEMIENKNAQTTDLVESICDDNEELLAYEATMLASESFRTKLNNLDRQQDILMSEIRKQFSSLYKSKHEKYKYLEEKYYYLASFTSYGIDKFEKYINEATSALEEIKKLTEEK